MRRILGCLLAILMILLAFSSCAVREENEKPTVVCSSFVQYDWVRQILGEADAIELSLLVGGGKDMHSYEPSAADMVKVLESDLLIYTGGVSEAWIDKLSARGELKGPLSLLACLGEHVKYLEPSGEAHGHEHTENEIDEHVWLSLRNAKYFCEEILEQLCLMDGENAETYRANCARYIEGLEALDGEYASLASSATNKTLVVADRYPYRYLFDDYGIIGYAAFSGCSAESEASFATVIHLAEKVDELSLSGILVTESSDRRLAETVRDNTAAKNAEIYELHSLQIALHPESDSYLSVMRGNLEVLKLLLT